MQIKKSLLGRWQNFGIEDLAVLLFAWTIFLALTCNRIDFYVPGMGKQLEHALLLTGTLEFIYLISIAWRSAFLLLLLATSIVLHSLTNLYQPSFSPNVPWLDYMLAPGVSANFCFDTALRYLFCLLVFAPGAFVCGLVWPKVQNWTRLAVYVVLALAVSANFFVTASQGIYDLQFLARGSGTAVRAQRAAALLEDSGASTVVISCFCAMFLGFALFCSEVKQRWAFAFIFMASILIGRFTGGRTFFASTAFAALVMLVLLIAQNFREWRITYRRRHFRLFAPIIVSALGIVFLIIFLPENLRNFFALSTTVSAPTFLEWLQALANNLDAARFSHFQVLWLDFMDHFLFGGGLGSFHANNAYYVSQISGAVLLDDNPSVFYLAILAALGIVGLLLIVYWTFVVAALAVGVTRGSTQSDKSADFPLLIAGLAIGSSFFMSFFFGVHFIFISAGAVFAIFLAAGVALHRRVAWLNQVSMAAVIVISLILLGRAAYLTSKPMDVAAFRWKETGLPQVPLSRNLPISPRGRLGAWLPSDFELATDGSQRKIYVELPPQFYPVEIRVVLEDHAGGMLWSDTMRVDEYILPDPGRDFNVSIPTEWADVCRGVYNDQQYCRLRISTSPSWEYEGCKIGYFLVY